MSEDEHQAQRDIRIWPVAEIAPGSALVRRRPSQSRGLGLSQSTAGRHGRRRKRPAAEYRLSRTPPRSSALWQQSEAERMLFEDVSTAAVDLESSLADPARLLPTRQSKPRRS